MTEPRGQMKSSNGASSSVTEQQTASVNSDVPSSSLSSKLCHSNYRRVRRTEDSSPYPIPGLASDILHMRVKEGSKIRNLLQFATTRMQGEERDGHRTAMRQVVFTGSGRGVTKTITCVEILKRRVGGLHQVSKLYYKTVSEVWESPQQGEPDVTMQRTVPAICILLSKDPVDPQEPGYQPPQTLRAPQEDAETHRALLSADLRPCSEPTAKRVRLDDMVVCSPRTYKS